MPTRVCRALVVAFLLTGCAPAARTSSGDAFGSSDPRRSEVAFDGDGAVVVNITRERRISSDFLYGSIDQVWFALARAYEDLAIPIVTVNRTARILGNEHFLARGNVARVPMTELLDCGFGMSGPMAAVYRITFDIHSQIRPAEGGQVEVQTLILATATPVEGTTNNPLPCTTTGALESLIVDRLKAALR
jgi:hypothetical protein